MTQRRRLDEFLAEHAASAGAEFRDGTAVDDIEPDGDGRHARGSVGTRSRADVLVGADGANGVVARLAGLGEGIVRGVALEGNVPLDALAAGSRADSGDRVRHGSRRLRLGLSEGRPREPRRRRVGERRAAASRAPRAARSRAWARRRRPHRTCAVTVCRCVASGTPAGAGRVLLVGDAAGLVDPLSGDGMYEAFVSARLAADAILAGDLPGYTSRALRRRSTTTRPRRGRPNARSTATRAIVFAAARAPASSRSSPACSAATWRIRRTPAASRASAAQADRTARRLSYSSASASASSEVA